MPQAKLVTCSACQSIAEVLCAVDKRLAEYGRVHKMIDDFELALCHPCDAVMKLMRYRRILQAKMFNPAYTDYTSSQLISRIKVLINA